jgi:hypothetical protein
MPSLLPEGTLAATAGRVDERNALARFWNRMAFELTDRRVSLNQIQEAYQREFRQPLREDQMVAFLARLNPGSQAEILREQGIGPAVRSVGQHYPQLVDYLVARSNISTAEGIGQREMQRLADAPIPRAVQNALDMAQRVLEQRQTRYDSLQRTGGSQAQLNLAERAVRSAEEMLARRQDAVRAAQQDVVQRATTEGARVAQERQFSGGLSRESSQQILDDLQNRLPPEVWNRIERAGDQIFDYGRRLRDHLVDAEVLSREQADELSRAYPDWMKTRILDYMHTNGPGGQAAGSRIGLNDTGLRNYLLEGTQRGREDPVASMIAYTDEATKRAHQNQVARALVDLDAASPNPQLRRVTTPEEMRAGQAPVQPGPGEEVINLFRNGVKEQYVTDNPMLAEAIRGADTYNFPSFARKGADWLRMAATARNPAFLVGNTMLDVPEYFLTTAARGGAGGVFQLPRITYELIRGYADAFAGMRPTPVGGTLGALAGGGGAAATVDRNDPNYWSKVAAAALGGSIVGGRRGFTGRFEGEATQRFLGQGGGMAGGYYARSPEAAQQVLQTMQRDHVFSVNSAADLRRLISGFAKLRWVEAIGQRGELAPRVAAMRVAERRGLGRVASTIQGRDVTMDFDQGGRMIKYLNQVIPFLNVGFQAPAKIYRLARQNPAGMAAAVGSMLIGPTIGLEAWNHATPQRARDYADVPDYMKDAGLVFMLPTEAPVDKDGNRRPQYIWINMRNWAPFVQMARQGAALAAGRGDVKDWRDLAGAVALASSPMQARNLADAASSFQLPLANTALQAALNTDFYRGGAIVSRSADENASALARAATPLVQRGADVLAPGSTVRPSMLDFLVRDSASGLGNMLLGAGDIAAGQPPRVQEAASQPVLGGFTGRVIRGQGGQMLETARQPGALLSPAARQTLREGGVQWEPTAVQAEVQRIPLRREEQTRLQQLSNQYVADAVARATSNPNWQRFADRPLLRERLLQRYVNAAHAKASAEVLKSIPLASRVARRKSGSSKD